MQSYERLLLENKAWAAEMKSDDPDFFDKLSKLQAPEFLWIGCSDSRVPANQITGTHPGQKEAMYQPFRETPTTTSSISEE